MREIKARIIEPGVSGLYTVYIDIWLDDVYSHSVSVWSVSTYAEADAICRNINLAIG